MKPLPIRAAEDLLRLLHQPVYRNQRFKLWLSYFEIYGGKLFDLLCDRKYGSCMSTHFLFLFSFGLVEMDTLWLIYLSYWVVIMFIAYEFHCWTSIVFYDPISVKVSWNYFLVVFVCLFPFRH